MDKEKTYLTRDEGDNIIWVWFKPSRGNWAPQKLPDCDIVVYQREDIENADHYLVSDFKKKFKTTVKQKTKRCCHLPSILLHNEDYKLISNDPDRKK